MADYYVKSGAAGTADGSSWTNAYTTIAAALTARAAGDRFWVSHQHAETQASAMTLTSPGTAASPCLIYCVNDGATPPTALATTATVTTTGTSAMAFAGFAYCYGISFSAGTGTTTGASINFTSTSPWWWRLDSCLLKLAHTNLNTKLNVGVLNVGTDDNLLELINTPLQFTAVTQGIIVRTRFVWRDTPSAILGTTLCTTLFTTPSAGNAGFAEISGVDLSALGTGKSLVDAGQNNFNKYEFANCKLGSGVSVITGTVTGQGGTEVFLENCDSGSTNYRMEVYKYQGSAVQETTKVLAASDGTTTVSLNLTSLAGASFSSPFASPVIAGWGVVTATGAEITPGNTYTATVEILHNSATNLKDDEVWLQLQYLGDSTSPKSSYAHDRKTDVLATAADQMTSTASWVTTGLANPNKQKLEVTFTPQRKGPIRGRVMLAKSTYTVYVDPFLKVA